VAEIFKRTPYVADLKPGGRYVAKDMYEIGGVPVLLKTLFEGGFIHGDCLTVTGKSMEENLANVSFPTDQDVIRPVSAPLVTNWWSRWLARQSGTGRRYCESCWHDQSGFHRNRPLL
jgi:dihydroxyacid dehydratase/phosphogluconate dehydratase